MMSMACGLAATGKVPYCLDLRDLRQPRAPTTRSGSASPTTSSRSGSAPRHGGVSLGEDGASHQMIEDIALMRAMPRMQVVVPADYNQAYRAMIESYERDEADVHALRPPGDADRLRGDPRDARRRRRRPARGQGHLDLSPAATWSGAALEAAETLEREDGVEAEVVNVSIIKPLDSQSVLELARQDRRRRHRRGAPRRRRARPTRSARSPPSSTRCRSSRSAWATSSASRAPARPAWSTSASPPAASPTAPARRCS